MTTQQVPQKKPRGFAGWPKEKRSAAARLGGIAAHSVGRAHEFTSEEARIAGRLGGEASSRGRGYRVISDTEVEVHVLDADLDDPKFDRLVQYAEAGDARARIILMRLARSAA